MADRPITSSRIALATAALLRSRRRNASAHRLRPLISSRAAEGGRAVSVIADLGVEQPVEQVDHEVEQDDERAVEHGHPHHRSEEHTSELQSLMRISYAVFCLKKKKRTTEMQ